MKSSLNGRTATALFPADVGEIGEAACFMGRLRGGGAGELVPEDADLGTVEEGEIDVAQDLPLGREDPSDPDERKKYLTIVCHAAARL